MKLLDGYESNKRMSRVCVFEDQLEALQTSKKNCRFRGRDKRSLIIADKMLLKEPKVKNARGYKMPTQNCRARGKTVTRRSWKG